MKQITLHDAEHALEETLAALSKDKHIGLHNLTIGLLGLCSELRKIREDVDRLSCKVDPILKEITNQRFPDVDSYRSPRP